MEKTLEHLQPVAKKTIGVSCTDAIEEKSLHLTLNCWLSQLDIIEEQTKQIDRELINFQNKFRLITVSGV